MKIATSIGYWSAGPPDGAADVFEAADRLRLDQVWTAEAYGSDAWTPLAWWGSRTSHVHLGTAVSQLSARPPATLAMAAMTMDHLTAGRVIVGVGTSNPQVVEGWYGQPYPRPLERTREYIDILRAIIAREQPVAYDGKHYQLPFAGGTGLGKPLRSILHPYRTEIPIYLGAEGPKDVALAAEIADGRPWRSTSAAWAHGGSTSITRSSCGWDTRRRPGPSRITTWPGTGGAPSPPSPLRWWRTSP